MSNIIKVGGGGGGSTPTLIAKSITQNGTYLAQDDNADGYSEVSVDVEGGGTVVQNLKLNEGKIATQTGEIVADSDYYYTDLFDMPSGNMMFDMNLNSNQTYDGLVIYDDNGNYNNYWNPNARFRVVNMASYYHQGYKCRLSFRKSNLDYIMLRDYNANILYTTNTPVIIGDEHYQWGNRGIDYLESWIINSKSAVNIPTTTTHLVYTDGSITTFENADNAGNETVTLGDITTFIGDASSFYWWVTANANMTYRIYNVLTGTLGELQTATSGTRIISDGSIATDYCMEIRRYS